MMPPVSEKQRRAMWAASEGKSKIGISEKVGREFVASDSNPSAAGVMLTEPNGAILFVKRSKMARDHAGAWALPGGMIEAGETPFAAALRELGEEIGGPPDGLTHGDCALLDKGDSEGSFWTYRLPVQEKFDPTLDSEHTEFQWASPEGLPAPLHPGVARLMAAMGKTQHASDHALMIALDRDPSKRSYDKDGHLHVEESIISKATVNPYKGSEIPGWEALGLDPNRIYMLLRDPLELEKGAPTFAGKPILFSHKPTTAEDHQTDEVVGAVMNPRWDAPDLKARLVVWPGMAIKAIEDDEKAQLSAGYRYVPVMEPGVYDGQSFDGRMTQIIGNHLALVSEGRVDGAVVADNSPFSPQWDLIEKTLLSFC